MGGQAKKTSRSLDQLGASDQKLMYETIFETERLLPRLLQEHASAVWDRLDEQRGDLKGSGSQAVSLLLELLDEFHLTDPDFGGPGAPMSVLLENLVSATDPQSPPEQLMAAFLSVACKLVLGGATVKIRGEGSEEARFFDNRTPWELDRRGYSLSQIRITPQYIVYPRSTGDSTRRIDFALEWVSGLHKRGVRWEPLASRFVELVGKEHHPSLYSKGSLLNFQDRFERDDVPDTEALVELQEIFDSKLTVGEAERLQQLAEVDRFPRFVRCGCVNKDPFVIAFELVKELGGLASDKLAKL